jgi:Flp pilus assembly protein TadB
MMEKESAKPSEDALMEQEENCRKGLKTLGKALFMRLFILILLVFILFQGNMELWVIGLMIFVMLITLAGALPLVSEWKKQRKKLREIMEQYE